MKSLLRILFTWVPFAVVVTGICGLIYLTVQQNYRQSLYDPQIQMAEDAAAALAKGVAADTLVPTQQIDIAQSLAPWIAIYDEGGTHLYSSGELDGSVPKLPLGVYAYTKGMIGDVVDVRRIPLGEKIPNEDRLTWQPQPGVRQAIIVVWVPQTKQFVIAGRNMREVEKRESALSTTVFLAWLAIMAVSLIAVVLRQYIMRKQ